MIPTLTDNPAPGPGPNSDPVPISKGGKGLHAQRCYLGEQKREAAREREVHNNAMKKKYRPGDMRIMPDPFKGLHSPTEAQQQHESKDRQEHDKKIEERIAKNRAKKKAEEDAIAEAAPKTKALLAQALEEKWREEEEYEAHVESRKREPEPEYDGFIDWAPTAPPKAYARPPQAPEDGEAPGVHSRYGDEFQEEEPVAIHARFNSVINGSAYDYSANPQWAPFTYDNQRDGLEARTGPPGAPIAAMDMAKNNSELPYQSDYAYERGGHTGVYNYTSGPAVPLYAMHPYMAPAPFMYEKPPTAREEPSEGYMAPTTASSQKGRRPTKSSGASKRSSSPARGFPPPYQIGNPFPYGIAPLHAPVYSTHYGAAPVGFAGAASPRGAYY